MSKELVEAAEAGIHGVSGRGSCQACFKPFAVRGKGATGGKLGIVLHGYTRPGYGYLIGQCRGVGYPPFELSCDQTKVWLRELVEEILPEQKKVLADILSGRQKTFATSIYDTDQHKYVEILVTEGQPPPQRWIAANERARNWPVVTEPDYKELRRRAALKQELLIRSLVQDIEWIRKKIAGWKYSPEALGAAAKPMGEAQTARRWLENPETQRELSKLPSPRGMEAGSFLDWVHTIPRTMMYTSRNGSRTPTYYKAVRATYEKVTKAPKLAVPARREAAVISREQHEKNEARQAKLAERERLAKEKEVRSAHRNRKATADVETLQVKVLKLLNDVKFVTWMKSTPWPNVEKPSNDYTVYDFIIGSSTTVKEGYPFGLRLWQRLEPWKSTPSPAMLSDKRSSLKYGLDVLNQWWYKSRG